MYREEGAAVGPQEIQIQCSSLLQSLFLILDKSFNFSVIQFVIPGLEIHILPENEQSVTTKQSSKPLQRLRLSGGSYSCFPGDVLSNDDS